MEISVKLAPFLQEHELFPIIKSMCVFTPPVVFWNHPQPHKNTSNLLFDFNPDERLLVSAVTNRVFCAFIYLLT